jgi:translocator protein
MEKSKGSAGDLARQVMVVVGTLVTLGVNGAANALPINGQTTAEVSDKFPVLFVPAGYVFAIWGLIYLGLAAYTVYQALPAQRTDPTLRSIGWLYVLTCAVNSVWIFLWHYELLPLTMLFMLALLGLLIAIYLRLDVGNRQYGGAMRWLVQVPFSIYLGWITVATIANSNSFLYDLGWDGSGIAWEVWAVILLVVAAIIGGLIVLGRRDVAYGAVLVWAFVGIAVKQSNVPLLPVAAWVMAALIAAAIVAALLIKPPARLNLQPRSV